MYLISSDELEITFGVSIFSDLIGHPLTRNRQPIRLFDQTRRSAEYFFKADKQGKSYVQNFAEGRRYYPISAYCKAYDVDYATAFRELSQRYGLDTSYAYHSTDTYQRPSHSLPTLLPIDYIPSETYLPCLTQFERNGFHMYLSGLFDMKTATHLFNQYRLGTSRRWVYAQSLSTCLPQFDTDENLRQVKVIPFHPITGRRAKANDDAQKWNNNSKQYQPDPNGKVWFAGKTLATSASVNLQQCYFGLHLLKEHPKKTVALVEGESTAIVCSAIWPEYIWLATGGSTGGNWYALDRFAVLHDRKVVLWPDSGKYDDWLKKSQSLRSIAKELRVSRYVEDNAPENAANIDLRDILTLSSFTLTNKSSP